MDTLNLQKTPPSDMVPNPRNVFFPNQDVLSLTNDENVQADLRQKKLREKLDVDDFVIVNRPCDLEAENAELKLHAVKMQDQITKLTHELQTVNNLNSNLELELDGALQDRENEAKERIEVRMEKKADRKQVVAESQLSNNMMYNWDQSICEFQNGISKVKKRVTFLEQQTPLAFSLQRPETNKPCRRPFSLGDRDPQISLQRQETNKSCERLVTLEDRDTEIAISIRGHIFSEKINVLHNASSVFADLLKSSSVVLTGQLIISQVTPEVFHQVLQFIKTGLATRQIELLHELYRAAHLFRLDGLIRSCRNDLALSLDILSVCPILMLVNGLPGRNGENPLKESALAFCCKNYSDVVQTTQWQLFCKDHPGLAREAISKYITWKNEC